MHKIFRNIFTNKQCENLKKFLKTDLSEKIKTNTGAIVTRTYLNEKWQYYFSRLLDSETIEYQNAIYSKIKNYEIVSFRTMHYPPGAMIGRHTDTYMEQDGESDTGLIIQLTEPNSYKDGHLRMSNEIIELNQGDGVLYSYNTPHEVTKIKTGNRWIASIRMLQKR